MAYSSHREYFHKKNEKILQQHEQQNEKISSLFHGLIFYFDGYVPDGTAKIKVAYEFQPLGSRTFILCPS